jgi:hypothetical protein
VAQFAIGGRVISPGELFTVKESNVYRRSSR